MARRDRRGRGEAGERENQKNPFTLADEEEELTPEKAEEIGHDLFEQHEKIEEIEGKALTAEQEKAAARKALESPKPFSQTGGDATGGGSEPAAAAADQGHLSWKERREQRRQEREQRRAEREAGGAVSGGAGKGGRHGRARSVEEETGDEDVETGAVSPASIGNVDVKGLFEGEDVAGEAGDEALDEDAPPEDELEKLAGDTEKEFKRLEKLAKGGKKVPGKKSGKKRK